MAKKPLVDVVYDDGSRAAFDKARLERSLAQDFDPETAAAMASMAETEGRGAKVIPVARLRHIRDTLRMLEQVDQAVPAHVHAPPGDGIEDVFDLQVRMGRRYLEVVQKLVPYVQPQEVKGGTAFACVLPAGPESLGISATELAIFNAGLVRLNADIAAGLVTVNRFGFLAVNIASGSTPNGGTWTYDTSWGFFTLCLDKKGAQWLVDQAGSGEAAATAAIIAAIPDIGPVILAVLGAITLIIAALNAIGSKGVCIVWGPFPGVLVLPRL